VERPIEKSHDVPIKKAFLQTGNVPWDSMFTGGSAPKKLRNLQNLMVI
jgi:hypothetical protein